MAVDIGQEAIDKATTFPEGYTVINKEAAASEAGNVTSIDIWAAVDITGLKIGVFYATNGNTLKCRSAATISGTITAGSKVNKVVSLSVEIGDYIGCYFTGGRIEGVNYGGVGRWTLSGDYCTVNSEEAYGYQFGRDISLGGYISVAAAGRSFGFIIG